MPVYQIESFRGGISDYEDKGIPGSFKFASNLDIRKKVDSISAGQALIDIGNTYSTSASISPSASRSPSASVSPSISPSISPSSSVSPSIKISPSASLSPSASSSPSSSNSPSASISPSHSISPSPSPSAGLHTVFSDLILNFVKCSDGATYGFGNTGKIYKINSDNFVVLVYDLHKKIIGAAEKPSSGGKTYLIFATNTELHRKEIPGRADWNDVDAAGSVQGDTWPKNNLTSADWHMMANVAGDILIGNDSSLAMSAYDDSYTNNALDLIPGNTAKTLYERNGRAVIGTVLKADPNSGINGAVDTEVPIAQVGTTGDIYYSDFNNTLATKVLPGGGKVNPGGMTHQYEAGSFFDWQQDSLSWIDKKVLRNMALMGVFNATSGYNGIYTFGRRDKNHPFALNLEYLLSVDEIGAVVSTNGVVYVSYRSGSSFGVMVIDLNNKATGTYEGLDFKAPMKLPIQITKWDYTELFMKPLPTGASVQFWYRVNKNGSFIQAYTADGNLSYTTATGKKAVFRINAEGEIFEPRVVVVPFGNNSPEVYRIRTFFK